MSFSPGSGPSGPSDYETGIRIKQLLESFGIDFVSKKDNTFFYVQCPFHGSNSKALWIHRGGRKVKCHKCGHESNWDTYAGRMGLPVLRASGPGINGKSFLKKRMESQNKKLARPSDDEIAEYSLPRNIKKWDKKWRKLKPEFLKKLPAYRWYDKKSGYDRIMFVITYNGKIVGYTAGRPPGDYGDDIVKYRTSYDLPTERMWFMFDQVRPVKILVVVEGPYDTMVLLQNRIPATGAMGSGSWGPEKTDAILMRPNLERVVVAGDGDEGGNKLWAKAKEELKGQIGLSRVRLPEGEDPGSMPDSWARRLRRDLIADTEWTGKFGLKRIKA